MSESHDEQTRSVAFLDVATFEDGQAFRGGILVTDVNTYPLEFRVTTPIRPTALQATLYGGALKEYIYVDLVSIALLRAIRSKPEFVLVTSATFLKARPRVHLPIFQIVKDKESFKLVTHPKYQEELQVSRAFLAQMRHSLLLETFSRVRAALQEAHKQKVGDK